MRHIPRLLAPEIRKAARAFAAVIVTGPRRAGKTTLLRRLFPAASYHLLEDPDLVARVRTDIAQSAGYQYRHAIARFTRSPPCSVSSGAGLRNHVLPDKGLVGKCYPFAQVDLRLPPERRHARDVEELARRAVGLRGVVDKLAEVAEHFGDEHRELGD